MVNDLATSGMIWEMVSDLVNSFFDQNYNKKDNKIMENVATAQVTNYEGKPLYTSLDQYKTATGKRFRMTKEQKARELTREQAFAEFQALPENCLPQANS
jgi:hypothetical protein